MKIDFFLKNNKIFIIKKLNNINFLYKKLKLIKSTVIESDDMYSPKNERILFQFVR